MITPEAPRNGSKEHLAQTSVALFDVDNTLIDGFSVFMFADHLKDEGMFDAEARDRMNEDHQRYKDGKTDYRQFAIDVVNNYSLGLGGQQFDRVVESGTRFVEKYKGHMLPYAEELLQKVRTRVDRMIAVSGAPLEAFMHLAEQYEFDEYHLLEAEVVDGVYTGRTGVNMALDERKREAVERIGDFDRSKSFAFGDSIHDAPILFAVENAFAVGQRDEELKELALVHDWPQVTAETIISEMDTRLSQ